jgi:rRNA maturation protein Nop10
VAVVIKADCPECGVVRLGTGDVTVRVCTDDGSGAYSFRCDQCGSAVSHPARPDVVELLVRAGCERIRWHLPSELAERRGGPSFTSDDLLDFHLLLKGDGWQRELRALVGGAS